MACVDLKRSIKKLSGWRVSLVSRDCFAVRCLTFMFTALVLLWSRAILSRFTGYRKQSLANMMECSGKDSKCALVLFTIKWPTKRTWHKKGNVNIVQAGNGGCNR